METRFILRPVMSKMVATGKMVVTGLRRAARTLGAG